MLAISPYMPLLDTAKAVAEVMNAVSPSVDKSANILLAPVGLNDDFTVEASASSSAPAGVLPNKYRSQPCILDKWIYTILVPVLNQRPGVDKGALLEGAIKFRIGAIQLEYENNIVELKPMLFRCLDILLRCSELGLCDHAGPVNAAEEMLEVQTVSNADSLFEYLETRANRLVVNMVPGRGKGLTLLRLCNELLRRISKAKNTVFCGRILVFLTSVFPLGERSGVNVKGDFNVENVTLIESNGVMVVPDFSISTPAGDTVDAKTAESVVPQLEQMEVDGETGKGKEDEKDDAAANAKADEATFYTRFWGLQEYFCNPALLVNSPEDMAKLRLGMDVTMQKFTSISAKQHQESQQKVSSTTASTTLSTSASTAALDSSSTPALSAAGSATSSLVTTTTSGATGSASGKRRHSALHRMSDSTKDTYFPKFLTSPKLLQLEIMDPYFRTHILIQFTIILQFLLGHTSANKEAWAKITNPNKALQSTWILEDSDREWAHVTNSKVRKEVSVSDPTALNTQFCHHYSLSYPGTHVMDGQRLLMKSMNVVFRHEENWIHWKMENCPPFERDPLEAKEVEETQRKRQKLKMALNPMKQKLGCRSLTDLWQKVEDLNDSDDGETKVTFGAQETPKEVEGYLTEISFKKGRALAIEKLEAQKAKRAGKEPKGPPTESELKASEELEESRVWRALRLGSRNYLHLFGKSVDENYSLELLKTDLNADAEWEEKILQNGGVLPAPKSEKTEDSEKTEKSEQAEQTEDNSDPAVKPPATVVAPHSTNADSSTDQLESESATAPKVEPSTPKVSSSVKEGEDTDMVAVEGAESAAAASLSQDQTKVEETETAMKVDG